jgi:hypothetical protein
MSLINAVMLAVVGGCSHAGAKGVALLFCSSRPDALSSWMNMFLSMV